MTRKTEEMIIEEAPTPKIEETKKEKFGKVEEVIEDILTPVLKQKKATKKPTFGTWYSPGTKDIIIKEMEEQTKDIGERCIAILGHATIYFSLSEQTQKKVIIFSVYYSFNK
jgi:hypothetical protein